MFVHKYHPTSIIIKFHHRRHRARRHRPRARVGDIEEWKQ